MRGFVLLVTLAACGGGPVASDGGAADSSAPAPHAAFPLVTDHGGPVGEQLQIVSLFYLDDDAASLTAFGDFLPTSSWSGALAEYGGAIASHVAVTVQENAPSSSSELALQNFVDAEIATDPNVPQPTSNTLYLVYYPSTTTFDSAIKGHLGCTSPEVPGVLHHDYFEGPIAFSYAAVLGCSATETERLASQVVIDADTDFRPDTDPAYRIDTHPWSDATPEVGDLCGTLSVKEGGYPLQRVWSNAGASASGDPCLPDGPDPYFGVSTAMTMVSVGAGESAEVTIDAWALGPQGQWPITEWRRLGVLGAFDQLAPGQMSNGDHATLKIAAPPGAGSGEWDLLEIRSATPSSGYSTWPIYVSVP